MLLYGFVKFKLNQFQETIYHFTIFNPPPPLPLAKINVLKALRVKCKNKIHPSSLYLTPFSANRRRPKTSKYFWKGHLLQNKNKTTNKQGPYYSIISIKNCKKKTRPLSFNNVSATLFTVLIVPLKLFSGCRLQHQI